MTPFLYSQKQKRLDGAIVKYANEEWLVLLEEPGLALNQSLTNPKRAVSGTPHFPFLGTEQYRLVSSVATGKWYGLSDRQQLCLYEYTLDLEKQSGSFFGGSKQLQHVASK